MEELRLEYWPVDKVMPYANNARRHGDKDVDAIMASILETGFNDPIGIWRGIIVEGHGRLLAAKRLGMSEVPVVVLDHLTDQQRRAYALAHNKTAELSEWDLGVLASELGELTDFDMSEFGFDLSAGDNSSVENAGDVEEIDLTATLPKSRLMICSVSAFGTNSEKFIEIQVDAERFLKRVEELGAEAVAEKMRGAVDGL